MVGFFPRSGRRVQRWHRQTLTLRTTVGEIKLAVCYGHEPAAQHWGCPMRQRWGLAPAQHLSPALQEKVLFTATATGTYEQAAAVATKWGCPMDDSTVHRLVQRQGARAEAQTQARLKTVPQEMAPARAPSALVVTMVDGWMARFRGPGWGREKTDEPRVEWHELKTGVFYRHEQASVQESGRGLLAEKVVVSWQGAAAELGERLHHEALRRGLGRALHPKEEAQVRPWVEERLHRLRHGPEKKVLQEIAGLKPGRGAAGKIVRREQNYFASQAGRMAYATIAARGWPIGSGAVESACRQRQCRYKRCGPFWTEPGVRHLCALEEARANGHWDQLWTTA